jgi:hypothetical protein
MIWPHQLHQDAGFALRMLRRMPGFSSWRGGRCVA